MNSLKSLIIKDWEHRKRKKIDSSVVFCSIIALLSPREFLLACERLPLYTDPKISLSTLKSGLKVLNTQYYESTSFGDRLSKLLEENPNGMQTFEIAQSEGITISLTYELIQLIEIDHGLVVRDLDDRNQVYWYLNHIDQFCWDDPNFG